MNKQRRNELAEIFGAMQDLREQLDNLTDAEQEAYDNMPGNLRDSERGEEMSDTISELNDAFNCLDNACDILEEILSK